ncbi:MAG: hypothetical protein ACREDI_15505, partial [Roseiarcus sp.]
MNAAPMIFEPVVKRNEFGGLTREFHGEGIDRPRDIEERILEGSQGAQRDEGSPLVEDEARRLILPGIIKIAGFGPEDGVPRGRARVYFFDNGAVWMQQRRRGES